MNLWGFVSAAVLLTLMPGPDILFVITQSITRGRKAGIIFTAGLCTGLVVHVTAVSLGLSVLLLNSPTAFTVLKFTGASYLVFLGIKTFIGRHTNKLQLAPSAKATARLYRRGILMNVLNPKVILFFIAFFPQFIDTATVNPMPAILLLGLIFMIQSFVIFSLVAVLAERISRQLMRNSGVSYWMNLAEAVTYCVIGIGIVLI